MDIKIVDSPLELKLSGVAKTHDPAKNYGDELIELLNVVWESVKRRGIPTTGINHVVYGDQGEVFAGVVITTPGEPQEGLSVREIALKRYAYYKHIGPYTGLPQANKEMAQEIDRLGLVRKAPLIEIYGHWNEDPAKLETELIYALE
jgi:effector-binding domain-containing protein